MPGLQRCELWTDYQCAGGTRVALVPASHCVSMETTDRVTRDDAGEIVLPKDTTAYGVLADGMVWRFLLTDGAFEEYRIWRVRDTSAQSRLASLQLRSPLYELGFGAAIVSDTLNGGVRVTTEWKAELPSQILARILAFCPSWWSAGTVTPTLPVNLAPDGWMPLTALRELVKAVTGQGVDCELDYRRNGTSGYFIDLVSAIGAAAAALDVRRGKNLLDTDRTRDRERYALEVTPLGAVSEGQRATMESAWLEVTAKASNTVTVQQPVTGGAVIEVDGQLDTLYLIDNTGARQLISNSGVDQQLDLASATNVTVGRWYRLARTSAGEALIRMRLAPATTGPVKLLQSNVLDDTANLTGNPAMRVWTGASSVAPDGWTKTGTVAKTTTAGLWLYGGQSCNVGAGGSLTSPAITVYVPAWVTAVTWSVWFYIDAWISGATGPDFKRDGSTIASLDVSSYALDTWHRVDHTESMVGLTGASRNFSVTFNTLNSTCYVDAVQVTLTGAARPFTEGSNPTRLLATANRYLRLFSSVPIAFECSYADLHAWDPTGFVYDEVLLGQTANVRDPDLDLTVSARLLERRRNWKNPIAGRLTVANRLDDLVTRLSGITN